MRLRWLFRPVAVLALSGPSRCQEDYDFGDLGVEEDSLSAEQLRELHAKLDSNGDGKASLKEIMDYSATVSKAIAARDIDAIMEELDTSKDGRISLREHLDDVEAQGNASDDEEAQDLGVRKEVEKAKYAAADADGDQLLDHAELAALLYPEIHDRVMDITVKAALRQKDTDGDGKLSAREFWEIDPADPDGSEMLKPVCEDTSEEAVDVHGYGCEICEYYPAHCHHTPNYDDTDFTAKEMCCACGGGLWDEQDDFAKLDSNGDGFISSEEMRYWESGDFDVAMNLFEISDADSDMHVTADELVAVRRQGGDTDAHSRLIDWAEHHEL